MRGVRLVPLVLVALLAVPAPGQARPRQAGMTPLEQAKEESGVATPPVAQVGTPAGALRLRRAELLAARHGQEIVFELEVERSAPGAAVEIGLPRRWRSTGPGGLRATRGVRGDVATLRLDGAGAGERRTLSITDTGIPAGRYRLPVRWLPEGEAARDLGELEVILYAPVREARGEANPWAGLRAVNVSNDATTESETYMTVVPGNPQRILASANSSSGLHSGFLSQDGGATWAQKDLPVLTDVKGEPLDRPFEHSGDPMSVADADGNIWYGNLSLENAVSDDGYIVVSRIPAGSDDFIDHSVAVPRQEAGFQDKNMMAIDNDPQSPTYGRLYVTWGGPGGGGVRVVVSFCDTRPGGVAHQIARCDDADNWTGAVALTPNGSFIYADAAVGPDGRVYVVWWDYANVNAIRGRTCPGTSNCALAANWTPVETIATLDGTGGPVPFACPIEAQPGGRASPAPMVETDISGGPDDGRVYVVWADLTGPGTTRCDDNTQPSTTHKTFDSFVASAVNELPGGASPSTSVGTRLYADGEGGGHANSDEWFPWLSVDQTTGIAHADFYSTRDDASRATTHFYTRPVTGNQVGPLTRVSVAPSSYSRSGCCDFANEYGDYTGIDATGNVVLPVWSDKSNTAGSDGEVFAAVVDSRLAPRGLTVTDPVPAGDGDGAAEPGETVSLGIDLANSGAAPSGDVAGTLIGRSGIEPLQGVVTWTSIGPGGASGSATLGTVRLSRGLPCATAGVDIALAYDSIATFAPLTLPLGRDGACRIAPRAAITGPATARTGEPVTFDASGSTDLDGTIGRYEWDLDGNGSFETVTGARATASRTYASEGTRDVRVRATDEEGDTGQAATVIAIAGAAEPFATLEQRGKRVRARRGQFRLDLTTCAGCKGTIRLQSARRLRLRPGAQLRRQRLARRSFSAPNGRARLRVRLSRAKRALLRRERRIRVAVTIRVTAPSGRARTVRARFTLRR